MINSLRGVILKGVAGEVTVDVAGVGYKVITPIDVWDELTEHEAAHVSISTYVREDRFELYGFLDDRTKKLFEVLIDLSGIGPRTALELCAVPRGLLAQAVRDSDPALLTQVKGIGKKTAEKLLIELSSVAEKSPELLMTKSGDTNLGAQFDQDAIAALSQLGFSTQDILKSLERVPSAMTSTEERVAAALKSL